MSDDFSERDFDRVYDGIEEAGEMDFIENPEDVIAPAPMPINTLSYPIPVLPKDNWNNKVDEKRRTMFQEEFAIAENWASKPGLTNAERCHGVVWAMHSARDARAQEEYDRRLTVYEELLEANPDLPAAHAPVEPSYRAPQYAAFYDENKASEIKEFLAKSAKELFD